MRAGRRRPRPLELLRDLCVYAPIGFLAEAPRLVPELVEAGRRRLEGAGSVGRLAAEIGQERWAQHHRKASHLSPAEPPPARQDEGAEEEIPVEVIDSVADATARPTEATADSGLPIPGYDQLAASQVVARLEGLTAEELAAVQAYEEHHRRRRTVLAKIIQLRKA